MICQVYLGNWWRCPWLDLSSNQTSIERCSCGTCGSTLSAHGQMPISSCYYLRPSCCGWAVRCYDCCHRPGICSKRLIIVYRYLLFCCLLYPASLVRWLQYFVINFFMFTLTDHCWSRVLVCCMCWGKSCWRPQFLFQLIFFTASDIITELHYTVTTWNHQLSILTLRPGSLLHFQTADNLRLECPHHNQR